MPANETINEKIDKILRIAENAIDLVHQRGWTTGDPLYRTRHMINELINSELEARTREVIESIPLMYYPNAEAIAKMTDKLKIKYGIK